ncbi:MAG TPA: SH3 domain-containing protein [Croceibacterium sp.]|nr:SH3 domain-containing protein [Croceibacterium sp.]
MQGTGDTTQAADTGAARRPMNARGLYALTGPQPRPEPGRTPLRGDLAHIALAGRYFVPHYAVPQPRTVMPGGARLMAGTGEGADELCTLIEGESFEVLEVSGGWAWGCLSLEGPVGYIRVDRLEQLP